MTTKEPYLSFDVKNEMKSEGINNIIITLRYMIDFTRTELFFETSKLNLN